MQIQDAECDGLSLTCYLNLYTIVLSLGHEKPVRPCRFVEKCLSTITSSQLCKVSLRRRTDIPICASADWSSTLWNPLDIILYDLAGKYQPRYEGDKMLVELVDVNVDLSEVDGFLWRYKERGTFRVQ